MGELIDKLTEYGMSGRYPFHMPGHKRNASLTDANLLYDTTPVSRTLPNRRPRDFPKAIYILKGGEENGETSANRWQ